MLCLSNDKMMNSMRLKLNSFWWSPVKSKHYICFTYLFMVILCLTFPLIFNWQSTDDVTQKMGSSCLYMMILYLTGVMGKMFLSYRTQLLLIRMKELYGIIIFAFRTKIKLFYRYPRAWKKSSLLKYKVATSIDINIYF
jgi:hypothetical protein